MTSITPFLPATQNLARFLKFARRKVQLDLTSSDTIKFSYLIERIPIVVPKEEG
jgi:hypothetical protein